MYNKGIAEKRKGDDKMLICEIEGKEEMPTVPFPKIEPPPVK